VVTFEVGYGQPPDTAAPTWTDVSSRVLNPVRMERGSRGEARLALNDDDGALHPDTVGEVLMAPARLMDGTTALWRGLVSRWAPAWSYNRAVREVRCVDAFAWFAVRDVDINFPEQKTGARIGAVLDAVGWPAGLRDIDAGQVWLSAQERDVVNVRQLLDDTADAEDGSLFVAADGTVTFRDRHDRLDATVALTVYGTGQTGDVGALDRIETPYDIELLYTIARVELEDGEVFEAVSANTAQYGERELPIRDLSLPGYQAEALAGWAVYRYATPSVWIDRLPVDTTEAKASVLAVDIGSRVQLKHETPSGAVETVSGHVEGIRHDIETGRYVTTFEISPWFGEGPWLTLGHATLGQVGTTNKIGP